jgi:hypothetical protein
MKKWNDAFTITNVVDAISFQKNPLHFYYRVLCTRYNFYTDVCEAGTDRDVSMRFARV